MARQSRRSSLRLAQFCSCARKTPKCHRPWRRSCTVQSPRLRCLARATARQNRAHPWQRSLPTPPSRRWSPACRTKRRESLTLSAVGHRHVVSLCYFITQKGVRSGWHGSWSADEHDDVGVPTRLTLFFSWRGTEAIQYRQVMQHSQDMTWTKISGQPTCISLKSWSMTIMLFVSFRMCIWEAVEIRDRINDKTCCRLTASSQPLDMVFGSSHSTHDEM